MPNKVNILKWVKALESGEYDQTRSVLKDSEGYCCLGVACEVARQNGVKLSIGAAPKGGKLLADSVTTMVNVVRSYDHETDVLPSSVREWLGVDHNDPEIKSIDEDDSYLRDTATALNDDLELDFWVIARHIRNTYLKEGS